MVKTNTPQVKIINCETGEEIVRDANATELAQMTIDAAKDKATRDAIQAKATAKAAILDRLGLTADELKTILG